VAWLGSSFARLAAGGSDRFWDMSDIVALIDVREQAPKKLGPYKPRQAEAAKNVETALWLSIRGQ
jgi:hypothetical protein